MDIAKQKILCSIVSNNRNKFGYKQLEKMIGYNPIVIKQVLMKYGLVRCVLPDFHFKTKRRRIRRDK